MQKGDRVDLSKFTRGSSNNFKYNGKPAYRNDKGYMLVKDNAAGKPTAHGGSYWKLLDKHGNRIGTLSKDGTYLRK